MTGMDDAQLRTQLAAVLGAGSKAASDRGFAERVDLRIRERQRYRTERRRLLRQSAWDIASALALATGLWLLAQVELPESAGGDTGHWLMLALLPLIAVGMLSLLRAAPVRRR